MRRGKHFSPGYKILQGGHYPGSFKFRETGRVLLLGNMIVVHTERGGGAGTITTTASFPLKFHMNSR